ncbi:hypothetical protein [Nocardia xishanensis]|uniref:Uncharacterized protein n=1 Tax=Nocardia xishanensis TaxID=238964 RepID=A0ABW7WXV7_9NOCA
MALGYTALLEVLDGDAVTTLRIAAAMWPSHRLFGVAGPGSAVVHG